MKLQLANVSLQASLTYSIAKLARAVSIVTYLLCLTLLTVFIVVVKFYKSGST